MLWNALADRAEVLTDGLPGGPDVTLSVVPMRSVLGIPLGALWGMPLAVWLLVCGAGSAWAAGTDDEAEPSGVTTGTTDDGKAELSPAQQTARDYRVLFAKLPTDLEKIEHVPSGRGLDSWALFVDHPELVEVAEALAALTQRESCDFGVADGLLPSREHHDPVRRATNLLLHRAVALLHGDRSAPPDDLGQLPAVRGVDVAEATRFGIASLNLSVHLSQSDGVVERQLAANAVPGLFGVARRAPQGLQWAADVVRASRFGAPAEILFGYPEAAIARLRLMARVIEDEPGRFVELFDLGTPSTDLTDPALLGLLDLHRQQFAAAAHALQEGWDIERPSIRALEVLRGVPMQARFVRTTLNEMVRAVAEIAAVREDIRVMLHAYPARHGADGGDANDRENKADKEADTVPGE